jgi:uncharacterized protein
MPRDSGSESPFLDFPFGIDGRGRIATTDANDHVRDMILEVLLTSPGERVNRPDFGCGLRELLFGPASEAVVTSTQFLVHGSLQRWLRDVIDVVEIRVLAQEESLIVEVEYVRLADGSAQRERFFFGAGGTA